MGGTRCFLVSDLHGRPDRYEKLFDVVRCRQPDVLFMCGDLLPHHWTSASGADAVKPETLAREFAGIRSELGDDAPRILLILGNDDERSAEPEFLAAAAEGHWEYLHRRSTMVGNHRVAGYSHVPPTPFMLKDWERYDVGRYVDPGSVSPEEGWRTTTFDKEAARTRTIAADLEELFLGDDASTSVLLAHSPPYRTTLDRAGLDGRAVDGAPLDVHVGSIAIRRFIEDRQPLLTLHGHIHEAPRITGAWRDRIGRTHCFTGAHDGPELALVHFDLNDVEGAARELL